MNALNHLTTPPDSDNSRFNSSLDLKKNGILFSNWHMKQAVWQRTLVHLCLSTITRSTQIFSKGSMNTGKSWSACDISCNAHNY